MKPAVLLVTAWLLAGTATAADNVATECVVLLHGLARTASSMRPVESYLQDRGFHVVNVDYPSTDFPVEELASQALPPALEQCGAAQPVHFVTHSMGGILVRYWLAEHEIAGLGRVVMLAPPNQGSELVDKLGEIPGFYKLNGPAGLQLGTGESSLPRQLPPVEFPLGVITGDGSLNPFYSAIIPGDDDGKVSVESTKVDGMTDFLLVDNGHTFIMRDADVLAQIVYFIQYGRFEAGT